MIVALSNRIECRLTNNNDEIFAKCLLYYWISQLLNTVLKRLLGGGTIASVISILVSIPPFAYFAIRAIIVLYKIGKLRRFLVPSILYCIAFFLSYVRGVPFAPLPIIMMWGLSGIFFGSIVISISNYETFFEEFSKKIPLIVAIALPAGIASRNVDDYLMHYSFMLVLPICICIYKCLEGKRKRYIVPAILLIAMIILYGSRGALGCIVAFIFLYVILKSPKVYIKVILIFSVFMIFTYYKQILEGIASFMESHELSSRTIWILINDPFHDSGRSELHRQAQALIDQHPLMGWGVAGERIHMEVYPHNIIDEFLIDFGKPIGYFLLVLCGILSVCGLNRCKGKVAFFYTAFISSAISLFWSGTYLSDPTFWMVIYMAAYMMKEPRFGIQDEYMVVEKIIS